MTDTNAAGGRSGGEEGSSTIARLLAIYLLVAILIGLLGGLAMWSSLEAATSTAPSLDADGRMAVRVLPALGRIDLSPGQTVYLFLVLMGLLGSGLSGLRALAKYKGMGAFDANWTWWYIGRPFIGAAVGPIVYWAMRTGIVGTSGSSPDVLDPFGVAIIGALGGLFSRNVLVKLAEVIDVVFGESPGGSGNEPAVSGAAAAGTFDRPPPEDQRGDEGGA